MNLFDLVAPIYGRVRLNDEKTFRMIVKFGDFKKTDKVLDLGGGTARIAKFFTDIVQEITVIDASRGMIAQCKKHIGIICILGGAERISYSNGYFDKVIIVDAFHHFQNKEKAVKEIRRVLKENGKIIIEEVDFGKLGNWFLEKLETIAGTKSKILSPQSLVELFSKNQFRTRLVKESRTGYYLIGEKG